MTEINIFNDPNKVPRPKNEIRIERLVATPYADRFRVHLDVGVTAFLERPSLLLVMRDAAGEIVGELSVIDTMHADMEFTLHIRHTDEPAGDYTVDAELFYETRNPPQDRASYAFSIPPADE